ncbi:MAG: AmpG permease, partial [uncultured Sphingomonadaceae bacterium]
GNGGERAGGVVCGGGPLSGARAVGRAVPRRVVRLSLRDDRRDAHYAAEAGRDRQVDHHRVRAGVPGLQSQVSVGVDRRRGKVAADRPPRPAGELDARRRGAGDRGGGQSRLCRPGGGRRAGGHGGDPGRGGGRDLRHRDRRLPNRGAGAAAAGRGFGDVAIRLAHRLGGGGRARAGGRRAAGLDRGLPLVCVACAAGDDRRAGARRAGAAARAAGAARLRRGGGGNLAALPRVLPASRGVSGAAVCAVAQDRRHARQPDAAVVVRRSRLHQRRDRDLGRGRGVLGVPCRHLHRRHPVRAHGAQAFGAAQPGADGGEQRQLRGAGGGGAFEPRHGGGDRLRELRQRDRRRGGGRLLFRAVRPALHRGAVRADLGRGVHRRAVPDGDHCGVDDRGRRLRELLPDHHRRGGAGDSAVLADDAVGTDRQLHRLGGHRRAGRRAHGGGEQADRGRAAGGDGDGV